MSGRLEEVQARLETVGRLDAVVTAMRGIVAVRLQEAMARLDGIRAYAATVGTAIGHALALADGVPAAPGAGAAGVARRIIVAAAGEQSFAGAFSRRIIERLAAEAVPAEGRAGGEILLVGRRGERVARELGLAIGWAAPMVSRAEDVVTLADRLARELYRRLAAGGAAEVVLIHAAPAAHGARAEAPEVERRLLLPFDFSRFAPVRGPVPPLTTLPPAVLLERLAREYVFAELCAALALSHAAENAARMRAMTGARRNIERMHERLERQLRELRQQQVTAEVAELAAGRRARARSAGGR